MNATRTIVPAIVAAALLLPSEGNGQTPHFEAGLQAGPAYSWLTGNKVIDDYAAAWGPAVGLTFQYDLSRMFGLMIGAIHQRKGTIADVQFTDITGNPIGNGEVRSTLDYLLFPLMARATFGNGPRFHAGAGPYAGRLMRARQTWRGEGFREGTTNTTDDFERWDLGISASAGVSFSLAGNLWLTTEVRYDKGLTNISALPVIDDGSIRTNAACLLAGFSYRFGGTEAP